MLQTATPRRFRRVEIDRVDAHPELLNQLQPRGTLKRRGRRRLEHVKEHVCLTDLAHERVAIARLDDRNTQPIVFERGHFLAEPGRRAVVEDGLHVCQTVMAEGRWMMAECTVCHLPFAICPDSVGASALLVSLQQPRLAKRGRATERFFNPQRLVPFGGPLTARERSDLQLAHTPSDREVDDRHILGFA